MKHMLMTYYKCLLFSSLIVSTVGCSHYPATASETMPSPQVDPPQEVLISEARAEADSLRSELATVKITTAKQYAQLQSALERIDTLTAREESMAQNVQQVKNTLLTAENERDRLRRENAELQAQSASLPDLQQLMEDVHIIQESVHQVMANMKTLMAEVIHIKQDMNLDRRKSQKNAASLTAFSMTTSSSPDESEGKWRVKVGDTLWSISQAHNTSVDALMTMNQLESDLIVEGQTLRVPVLAKHSSSQLTPESQTKIVTTTPQE